MQIAFLAKSASIVSETLSPTRSAWKQKNLVKLPATSILETTLFLTRIVCWKIRRLVFLWALDFFQFSLQVI